MSYQIKANPPLTGALPAGVVTVERSLSIKDAIITLDKYKVKYIIKCTFKLDFKCSSRHKRTQKVLWNA